MPTMPTIKINPTKLPQVSKIAAPKLPQGRLPSGFTQFRASSSSYGKLAKLAGVTTKVGK
jgi:hypothetical protein